MTKEELREYQLSQLELLEITDRICKELDITYYLIGGTLLGAVRHKGFIPWDADIDIAMPRADYEVYRRYWEEHKNDRYFYQHYTTEKNHLQPHAVLKIKNTKVILNDRVSNYLPQCEGIYMDIFPLDNPPESPKQQKKQAKKIKRINRIIELKAGYRYGVTSVYKMILKKMLQFALSPVSFTQLNKELDTCMKKYSTPNGRYLVSMASHYSYWKQLMPADIYGTPARILFENEYFNAPAKTDEYLTRIYKNYMEIPPDADRYSILDYIESVEYSPSKE